MPYCAVCRATVDGVDRKVILVPRDPVKKKLWEDSLERTLGKDSRICDQHFNDSDWKAETNTKKPTKRRLLMPNAVPQKLREKITEELNENIGLKHSSSQTDSETITAGVLLENMRLKEKIRLLEEENAFLRQDLNSLQESLSNIFTFNQIKKLKTGQTKVKWSSADMSYSICLHTAGPRAYHHLYNKGFPLPSLSTLQRWSRKVKIETGTLDVVLDLMEHSVDLLEDEKLCVLSFDAMKICASLENDASADVINEPCNYVQVAIVRGLKKSWKQPIFFDYDCRMDVETLHNIVTKLYKAGYPVVAVVCDLGPGNQKLWRELGISETKTWFQHPANEDLKIFAFADVPHLIKLIRNHFLDTGFIIDKKIIAPQTVKEVMNYTSSSDLSITLKINEDHINVENIARQKVNLATQLFSNSTACAIRRCFELGYDVFNACETADFFKLTNDWFDIFNSKLSTCNSLPCMQPYGKNLEQQRSVLVDMTRIMSTVILPKTSKIAPFQKGIVVNNLSIDELYSYLVEKYKIEYILSNRLSQDVLQQFFEAMREKDGHNDNPSSLQFQYRLRKYIMGTNKL